MIKFGKIKETDPAKGLVRVYFEEDDLLSDWIPYVVKRALEDTFFVTPTLDEQVACLFDHNVENGVVLGAIHSDDVAPQEGNPDTVTGVIFRDGTTMKYDSDASELTIENTDSLTITVDAATSVTLKSGTSEVTIEPAGLTLKRGSESLKAILDDILTQIAAETHPTAVGPSGPPINVAAYIAIQARLPLLFK